MEGTETEGPEVTDKDNKGMTETQELLLGIILGAAGTALWFWLWTTL